MGLVHRQRGFTLTEVLVTTVVIGVLAATMLPALMRQTTAADPARLVSELGTIKTGIEVFGQNVRPFFPGDLDDLVNTPTTGVGGDETIGTTAGVVAGAYTANAIAKWKGPYVAQSVTPAVGPMTGNTTWRAGANGFFAADLEVCDVAAAGAACTAIATGPTAFVRVQVSGLSATEINELDLMIDGVAGLTSGLLRSSGTDAFYYAVPFTP